MGLLSYIEYRRTVNAKQTDRKRRIDRLREKFPGDVSPSEREILSTYAEDLATKIREGQLKPIDVLTAYTKEAIKVNDRINCITEVPIEEVSLPFATSCAPQLKTGPLAGLPVSLKDTVAIQGFDSCMGYVAKCNKPYAKDAAIIRLLEDAGAVPFVKTNVPYTLLSFESYNDVWGVTDNPHVPGYSAGGSTGGEAALLAAGGSRLGIGTDVAGSVRLPAHFSGCYTIKCSTGRFPKAGNPTTMPGQEGVPAVYSPMTRTLKDLGFFLKVIIDMKPWEYDYSVHPLEWRDSEKISKPAEKVTVGVLYDDGVVTPSPACARALKMTVDALKKKGYNIVEFEPPSPLKALRIGSQLLCSDACKVALKDKNFWEHNDAGVARMVSAQRLPRFIKKIWAFWVRYIRRDPVWAYLIEDWNEKTITERWGLVYERETYRAEFFDAWKESGIDFLLTVPNATPAFPYKGLYDQIASCGYTFLFNILDYAAGVLPVTHVNRETDQLPSNFNIRKLNGVAQGAYMHYNADKMHGLPVGVQVVTRRLQEEKCYSAMCIVEQALKDEGITYPLLTL